VTDARSRDKTLEILKLQPHRRWGAESDEGQRGAIDKGSWRATGAGVKFQHPPAMPVDSRWHGTDAGPVPGPCRIKKLGRVERFCLRDDHRASLTRTRSMQFLRQANTAKRTARRLYQGLSRS